MPYGICGSAIDWILSFLSGHSQQVFYKGRLSIKLQLLFGAPQGSVLGPYILFLLYTAELCTAHFKLCDHLCGHVVRF